MENPRFKNILRALIVAVLPGLVIYVLAISLSAIAGIKGILVIRDLAQTCGSLAGVGLISNLGYLIWMATAAIVLFTAYASPKYNQHKFKGMLLCGGWFSFILCIDDMFLLHDRYIGPTFLYIFYAIFSFLIVSKFRDQLLENGGEIFILAVILLGFSVLTDNFQYDIAELMSIKYETTQLFEEGIKFLGITTWLYFWWSASSKFIRSALIH